jgi:hypothetical protein
MVEIKQFNSNIGLGEFPLQMSLYPITYSSDDGIIASTTILPHEKPRRVEVRVSKSHSIIALLTYYAKQVVLPEFWQNAEVVWAIDLGGYKEEE